MIIGLERSTSLIYDRIVLELARGFEAFGHKCVLFDPAGGDSSDEILEAYRGCDWVIITNDYATLSQKVGDQYLFETLALKYVFLHHDALSHNSEALTDISEKVQALMNIKDHSVHFFIEREDMVGLKALGIACHPIAHMNTLGVRAGAPPAAPEHDIAFVGHAIPPPNAIIAFGFDDQQYYASYLSRQANFAHNIRSDFQRHQCALGSLTVQSKEALAMRVQYLLFTNYYSLWLRGSVLQRLNAWNIDLYGGDPSWVHGAQATKFFTEPNIRNHAPVFQPTKVREIFANSKINLNITSLQFDTGVINRVIDAFGAGGFVLTDKKEQLAELTTCAEHISFSSPSELLEKVAYFLRPDKQGERRALIDQIQRELSVSASLENTIQTILQHPV